MADIVIKRGDTRPPLVFQLSKTVNSVKSSMDLTQATSVVFQMRLQSGVGNALGGTCTVPDAVNGVVIYVLQIADTATAGPYEFEFQITWSDGGVQTVPSGNQAAGTDIGDFMTIDIVEDIDGTAPVLR